MSAIIETYYKNHQHCLYSGKQTIFTARGCQHKIIIYSNGQIGLLGRSWRRERIMSVLLQEKCDCLQVLEQLRIQSFSYHQSPDLQEWLESRQAVRNLRQEHKINTDWLACPDIRTRRNMWITDYMYSLCQSLHYNMNTPKHRFSVLFGNTTEVVSNNTWYTKIRIEPSWPGLVLQKRHIRNGQLVLAYTDDHTYIALVSKIGMLTAKTISE